MLFKAQNNYFTEFTLTKAIATKKENLNYYIYADFKNIYNNKKWLLANVYGTVEYQIKPWTFIGGLKLQYTDDQKISNIFEIRTVAGVAINLPIIQNKIDFNQRFLGEARLFIYSDKPSDTSARLRYLIGFTFRLSPIERQYPWYVKTNLEWYILNDKNIKQRFVDIQDFTTWLNKVLPKKKEIGLGLVIEKYSKIYDPTENNDGITIMLNYTF